MLYFINAFLAGGECEVRRLFAAVWVNWSLLAQSKGNGGGGGGAHASARFTGSFA